jgi:light-regulated signal transduction histidine kinase (bacteriophytochrome)
MRSQIDRDLGELAEQRALLAALSDDLTLPFLQIKTTLELLASEDPDTFPQHHQTMFLTAENGLQLIEAYRLALAANDNATLALEPVAIGAVLQDVAHQLSPYAKRHDTAIEVNVSGRLRPVLAHKLSLEAALQCLGTSLMRAQVAQNGPKNHRILLAAHRSNDSLIAAGVFSDANGLSDRTLRAARSLIGKARQPLASVPNGAASGVLIADMLCSAMWQPLRSAAHHNMRGLVTAVPFSKQIQFI